MKDNKTSFEDETSLQKVRRYRAGSTRSQQKLAELGFDPIESLVAIYHDIIKDIKWEEDVRDEVIVRVNGKGNKMAWYPDNLHKLKEMRANIADKLIRYGYGRVPETVNVESETMQNSSTINIVVPSKKLKEDDG